MATNQHRNESGNEPETGNQHQNETEAGDQHRNEAKAVSASSTTPEGASVFLRYAGQSLAFSDLLPPVAMEPRGSHMAKYWSQRYRLFSKFDQGVCLDNGTAVFRCCSSTTCTDTHNLNLI